MPTWCRCEFRRGHRDRGRGCPWRRCPELIALGHNRSAMFVDLDGSRYAARSVGARRAGRKRGNADDRSPRVVLKGAYGDFFSAFARAARRATRARPSPANCSSEKRDRAISSCEAGNVVNSLTGFAMPVANSASSIRMVTVPSSASLMYVRTANFRMLISSTSPFSSTSLEVEGADFRPCKRLVARAQTASTTIEFSSSEVRGTCSRRSRTAHRSGRSRPHCRCRRLAEEGAVALGPEADPASSPVPCSAAVGKECCKAARGSGCCNTRDPLRSDRSGSPGH
jgi:hypothetical protein